MAAHKIEVRTQVSESKNGRLSFSKLSSMTENAHTKKLRLIYSFSAVFLVALLIGTSFGMLIDADGPTGFGTVIEPGSMVEGYSYLIFRDGATYFAKNATNGAIDYEGTNASSLINAVISNIPMIGGAILFRAGDYDLTAPIDCSKISVAIRGEVMGGGGVGTGARFVRYAGNFNLVELIGTIGNRPTYNVIERINFISVGGTGALIYGTNTTYLKIVDCQFQTAQGGAIYLYCAYGATIYGNRFSACGNVALSKPTIHITGSNAYQSTSVVIDSNEFSGDYFRTFQYDHGAGSVSGGTVPSFTNNYVEGILGWIAPETFIWASNSLIIENNAFMVATGIGIKLSTIYSSFSVIANNRIDSCGLEGIYAGSGARITNNYILSCFHGITTGDDGIITGNHLTLNDHLGVNVTGDHGLVANNVLHANGWSGTGDVAAIKLLDALETLVNGNSIYDVTGTHQTSGIIESGVANSNVITNNQILDCTTPVLKVGALTIVKNNVGYVTENKGTATITTSTSVVFNHGLATTPTLVIASFSPIGWGNYTWTATTSQITITVSTSGTYTVYWYAWV